MRIHKPKPQNKKGVDKSKEKIRLKQVLKDMKKEQ